jgi:hypothetical protein
MSDRNPLKPPQFYDVAGYLADREGLVGEARARFRRLLDEYGSFRQVSRPRRSITLIMVSVLLSLAGFGLDRGFVWESGFVWLGCLVLAAVPIWQFRREERRDSSPDREGDWQAYCHFLRPVVLSEHPGLLDRNLGDSRAESGGTVTRVLPMYRELIHERGSDFWWSVLLGLWLGMAALAFRFLAAAPSNWMASFIIPAGGMVLGPAIWTLWKRSIYLIAKSDARTGREGI